MRINCVPVKYLTDQHLRAEWVEFLMLPAYLKRSIASKDGLKLYEGDKYTLNTGHARFFYDKLTYVAKRYVEIEVEMLDRGYAANPTLDLSMFPKELFNDWIPDKEAVVDNANRILTRIEAKPRWYTFRRRRLLFEDLSQPLADEESFKLWKKLYETWLDFKYEFKDSDIKKS